MRNGKSCLTIIIFFFVVMLSGCSPTTIFDKSVPEGADKFARSFLNTLIEGDVAAAEKLMDPKLQISLEIHEQFEDFSRQLSEAGPFEVTLVHHSSVKAMIGGRQQTQFTYELKGAGGNFVTNMAVDRDDDVHHLLGIFFQSIEAPLAEINAFTFSGKSTLHFIFFFAAVAIPIFVIYTVHLCYRTKRSTKWFWIIAMLLGLGHVSMNWTNGEFGFNVISITSVWAPGIRGGLTGAWFVALSFPVVPIIYHLRRRNRRKHGETE